LPVAAAGPGFHVVVGAGKFLGLVYPGHSGRLAQRAGWKLALVCEVPSGWCCRRSWLSITLAAGWPRGPQDAPADAYGGLIPLVDTGAAAG